MIKGNNINYNEINNNLFEYFRRLKHKGLDPDVILGSPKLRALIYDKNKIIRRIKASFWRRLFTYFGKRVIFLFEPFKKDYYHIKAICLYLMAKIELDTFDKDEEGEELLKILDSFRIPGTYLFSYPFPPHYYGEGYSINSQFSVILSFVAELFFKLYNKYTEEKYLIYFKNVVEAIVNTIPIHIKNNDEICFYYDNVSRYFVHNANLLVVEMITKYNYLFNEHDRFNEFNSLIEKGLNYSLNDYKRTSSYYYSGEETRNKSIDNYHTGYVLRSINEINKYRNNKLQVGNLIIEINKLLEYYIRTFVKTGFYIYKWKLETIEAHSLAESILVYSLFYNKIDEKTRKFYLKKINRTIKILYKDKKFVNSITTCIGIPIISDNLDYIRWAQAWMLYALSNLIHK